MNEQKMIDLVNRIANNDKVAPFQNGFVVLTNEEMVRFAELIVLECVDVVLAPHNEAMMSVSMDLCKFSTREAINRAAQSGGLKVHTRGIANQIRQHFGVGE